MPKKLLEAIIDSPILRKGLTEATSNEDINTFLKAEGYEMSAGEFGKFLKEEALTVGNVSEETLEMISGDEDFDGWMYYWEKEDTGCDE